MTISQTDQKLSRCALGSNCKFTSVYSQTTLQMVVLMSDRQLLNLYLSLSKARRTWLNKTEIKH